MKFRTGRDKDHRSHGPSVEKKAADVATATPQASRIISSCNASVASSHHQHIFDGTALEILQRPVKAYLKSSEDTSGTSPTSTRSEVSLNECCASAAKPTKKSPKMGFSKSQRIMILLGIDSAFFILEISVGYRVHSLALVADAFHMLNDVISLLVGLWAVKIANTASSKMYTYGWQRAETLGALVNGVFLVALCLSIFLDAIQRFVEPQVVSNPKLVMIVGCCGLASNILGLFLFHDHGHGHSHGGGDDHSHSHDPIKHAEEGHTHHEDSADQDTQVIGNESGNIEDVLPQTNVVGFKTSTREGSSSHEFTRSDEDNTTISARSSRTPTRKSVASGGEIHGRHRRKTSGSFGRGFGSVDNIHIHPASFRNEIIQAGRLENRPESDTEEENEAVIDVDGATDGPDEHSRLMHYSNGSPKKPGGRSYATIQKKHSVDYAHDSHNHTKPKESTASGGHGHSHGDLNMRGVFLHVMGDALGNIGVIASALFIWLTTFKWRYYVDPGVSLIITAIILTSALPLCRAAGRILLQAVPVGMSIDEITADIEELPRVIEAHHLHVWQLSDTKLVCSLHVKVDCEVEGTGSASYMHLAREIRRCLHGYGIHSSTIQPEFCMPDVDGGVDSPTEAGGSSGLSPKAAAKGSKAGSLRSNERSCLLDCGDNCGTGDQCCPPETKKK